MKIKIAIRKDKRFCIIDDGRKVVSMMKISSTNQ